MGLGKAAWDASGLNAKMERRGDLSVRLQRGWRWLGKNKRHLAQRPVNATLDEIVGF